VLEVDEASPQSIAVIANGCANANFLDVGVMDKLLAALKHQESIAASSSSSNMGGVRTSESGLSAQGVALLVNSLYRLKHRDEAFLSLICSSALRLPASSFRPHPLALTLNGLSGLGWYDHDLMERLHESTMLLTPETPGCDPQLPSCFHFHAFFETALGRLERICEHVLCSVISDHVLCSVISYHVLCSVISDHVLCSVISDHVLCSVISDHVLCSVQASQGSSSQTSSTPTPA